MPLRLPDRCAPDCVREFRAAAAQRFIDAQSLARSGRRTAAIYLWGYAAEMTLQAAYFAALGFPESQTITLGDLRAAVATAAGLGVVWPGLPRNARLHDVRAWAEMLGATRASRVGLAYPDPAFGNRVVTSGLRIQRLWNETLRYRKNVAYTYEMNQVRDAVSWLLLHSSQL